jgi:hypothetical protein
VLVAGCGGTHRLGDGTWYGAVTDVDAAGHDLAFTAACRREPPGGWLAVTSRNRTLPIAPGARFTIYYRPNGDAAAGHSQPAGLRLFRQVARHGRAPDFHPGWLVTVKNGAAVSVEEDSGLLALHIPACS